MKPLKGKPKVGGYYWVKAPDDHLDGTPNPCVIEVTDHTRDGRGLCYWTYCADEQTRIAAAPDKWVWYGPLTLQHHDPHRCY